MPKEKSIVEMRAEALEVQNRAKAIVEKAKGEQRKLNEGEERDVNAALLELSELRIDIATREAMNAQEGRKHAPSGGGKFSLRRAIVAHMNGGDQRDVEAKAIEEARKAHDRVAITSAEGRGSLILPFETRASYTAAAEAATGVVVDEDMQELLLPLEANLVLSQAGVRMMTGLTGNISWPSHDAVETFWEGENASAQDGKNEGFKKGKVYSPKRLTARVDISKQLLIQENRSVEALLRQLFAVSIAQKIERTAFGKAAHADNVPDGIFQDFDDADALGAITWPNVVQMETHADLQNALFGNLAYILHPSLVGTAKTKVKDTSGAGGFLIGQDGKGILNGYKALRTNNMPEELGTDGDQFGALFGNWADYFLGQWGAMDITVDPYTRASEGEVRLVINSYWNMGQIRKESFTVASMK